MLRRARLKGWAVEEGQRSEIARIAVVVGGRVARVARDYRVIGIFEGLEIRGGGQWGKKRLRKTKYDERLEMRRAKGEEMYHDLGNDQAQKEIFQVLSSTCLMREGGDRIEAGRSLAGRWIQEKSKGLDGFGCGFGEGEGGKRTKIGVQELSSLKIGKGTRNFEQD